MEAYGKNTSININSKSISKGGGEAVYRSVVHIGPHAEGAKGAISCESLMLDDESRSDTIPTLSLKTMILIWDMKRQSDVFRMRIFIIS